MQKYDQKEWTNMNIHFGTDYYPEHWPTERWELDAKLMKEMGIQVVRLAEFSWHKMEPEEGKFDFEWLDRAIELMSKYNIKVVLGTPSAAPPAWLVEKYPEILPVDRMGRQIPFGGRHHDCQSNPVYREYVRKIVTEMAVRYGNNENVIGWQPDNELGNSHNDLCTCDSCTNAFQIWLHKKYNSVEKLNSAWGNAFWSQERNSFKEIKAPKNTLTGDNPSAILDWKRFCSDLVCDFMREQTSILRKYCKNQFITHNYMGFSDKVDYYRLAEQLDFVSQDQYPGGYWTGDPTTNASELAATLDVIRGYKHKNFWIMEQQAGVTGGTMMGRLPAPGQLSLWTAQAVAHGADAVVYFRWRTCAFGTEEYWHGILPHCGIPGRTYRELKTSIEGLTPVMEQLQDSMPNPEVGILFSFTQQYAYTIQPHHKDLSYIGQVIKYHRAFYKMQVPVDMLSEEDAFDSYKLLVAPFQYVMTLQLAEKFSSYVANGGHLVLTMRTGVKNDDNTCMTELPLPGILGKVAGVTVEEYDCLVDTNVKVICDQNMYTGRIWSDVLTTAPETETIAEYASEFYKGRACVTAATYGKGVCYYIGTEPDDALMDVLCNKMVSRALVQTLGKAEPDVELTVRETNTNKWFFALNHSGEKRTYQMSEGCRLILGKQQGILEPYEFHVLESI